MHSRKSGFFWKVFVCLILSLFVVSASAKSSRAEKSTKLPATIGIGTHAVGGAYHASGTGVAALISNKTKIRAVVQPFGGPNTWMPLMEKGELELGLLSGFDAAASYAGVLGWIKPYKNERLVLRGNVVSSTAFTTLKRAGFKKITDLKGKRVAAKYGASKMLHNLSEAMLASAGMTWDDVVAVPVPDFKSSIRMLREGRIDVGTTGANTTPAARELDSAVGVHVLAFGDMQPSDMAKGVPPDKQAVLNKILPGCFPKVAKGGVLKKPTVLISYPIYMAASVKLSNEAVYVVLKAIWENYSDLHSVHPWLRGWKPESMLAVNQPAPYHEGAIKFYKEKGLWTGELQKRQDELLRR